LRGRSVEVGYGMSHRLCCSPDRVLAGVGIVLAAEVPWFDGHHVLRAEQPAGGPDTGLHGGDELSEGPVVVDAVVPGAARPYHFGLSCTPDSQWLWLDEPTYVVRELAPWGAVRPWFVVFVPPVEGGLDLVPEFARSELPDLPGVRGGEIDLDSGERVAVSEYPVAWRASEG
jgi:hypothetical protein